jgi:hypothetical protein
LEISSLINKIKSIGLKVVFLKTIYKLTKPFIYYHKKKRLSKESSFIDLPEWFDDVPFSYFKLNDYTEFKNFFSFDFEKIENILSHKFDLLGSDNLSVSYDNINQISDLIEKVKNGYEINSANTHKSLKILDLIQINYKPVNWQCDFKSKYVWKTNQISEEIKYGDVENVDIKVPWELARFNDFSVLAVCHFLTTDKKLKEQIEFEVRNRILDFIAMNPPEFGVNWINSMEVSIRAVNWLVAFDILRQSGADFDGEFKKIFFSSIYSHYRFIIEHPEWSSGMRGNHYFTNICSLLIISSYLAVTKETTQILLYSIIELVKEFFYQFNDDGSNFEASTYYHCFVLEVLLFTLDTLLKLPKQKIKAISEINSNGKGFKKISKDLFLTNLLIKDGLIDFDKEFWKRLLKVIQFTDVILLKDGSTINIGDGDSGRYLKFSDGNYLWLREFIDNIVYKQSYNNHLKKNIKEYFLSEITKKIRHELVNLNFDLSDSRKSLYLFKDFGLYVFNNQQFKLYFRCGSIGQKGKGGHAHNDQLSIILLIDEIPIFIDSGTYIYTGNHKMRNMFRSTEMHNTLSINGLEQNQWNIGSKDELFWLRDTSKAKITKINENEIEGIHFGFDNPTLRKILINDKSILGEDLNELLIEKKVLFHLNHFITELRMINNNTVEIIYDKIVLQISSLDGEIKIEDTVCSPEYGKLMKNKVIIISSLKQKIQWTITIIN